MKTIKDMGAQGDVLFRRVDSIPDTARKSKTRPVVVAHSETGHNHECEDMPGIALDFLTTDDPFVSYLDVKSAHVDVVHKRDHDTHETVRLEKGKYEVRRQREHAPEGLRMVAD